MKKHTFLFLFLCFSASMIAQDFLSPSDRYSTKEEAYIFLKDGTEVVGIVDDIDRKKGMIEEITLEVNGKKMEYNPDDIDHMYLKPSQWNKLTTTLDKGLNLSDHKKDKKVNNELIEKGYVLFETTEVMQKKKKRTLMLQLLNPHFCDKIRVYQDPLARESARVGVGAFTVAGGEEKSYYVKVGDGLAERLKSKDYEDFFASTFKSCSELASKFEDAKGWKTFAKHLHFFTYECVGED